MDTVAAGHELAGRYVVDQQLGMGGSGQVWKAHDTVLDRPVAVKVVPDGTAAARLSREARAAAGIGVPNVVGVYDVGEQDGVHFLVMEYVEGVDLSILLQETGALEPNLAALVGRDVARGLAAVHGADLVHRDVTPANVLVTTEGQVKLTDLGIARRTDAGATRQLTQPGTVVGTVDYLAPEQVEGEDVSAASDVYAVGLLLHTALTGRAPFGDGPMSERVARRLAGGPDQLGQEVGALADVVAAAVQQDPQERPPDGRALLDALAALVPDDEEPLRERLAGRVTTARGAGPAVADETTDAVEGMAIPVDGARRQIDAPADPAPSQEQAPATRHEGITATTELGVLGGTEDAEPSPAGHDRDGPSLLGPIAAAVGGVVVVVGVVSTLLAGGGGAGGGDGGGADGGGGGTQSQPLAIAAVDDHDPLGGGDEHGDEMGRVVDGDGATAWDTEGYESPDLGGLKAGVGFLVDLGEAREVAAVEVDLVLDGVDVAVTVSDERPGGDPTAEATVLGSASDAGGTVRIEGEPVTGTWVAVWFTSLADDGARFRAEVAEVRVFGI